MSGPGNARSVPLALAAGAVMLALLVLVILLFGSCAHPPDPLLVSADALNVASGLLTAKVRAHNARTEQLVSAALARCAPQGEVGRILCETDAARSILDETAGERALLDQLDALAATARGAIHLADQCRRDGAACEGPATTQAVETLERLRVALGRSP